MPKGPNWRVIEVIKEFGTKEKNKNDKRKKGLKVKNRAKKPICREWLVVSN